MNKIEEPDQAILHHYFSGNENLIRHYVDVLSSTGIVWGLIGPREPRHIWSRHIFNCAALSELIPPGSKVLDVGSGAGLPGFVLSLARPDCTVVLLEPMKRRAQWLQQTMKELEHPMDLEVVNERAEEAYLDSFDVVTSRALGPLPRQLEWAPKFTRPGGQFLPMKGAKAQQELDALLTTPMAKRIQSSSVVKCGTDVLETPTTVISISFKN